MRIPVLHITNTLGIGGTERNLQTIAAVLDFDIFTHVVCTLLASGERETCLKKKGIPVYSVAGRVEAVGDIIRQHRIAVVVIHRAGRFEAHWWQCLMACAAAKVGAIVEVNIFGLPDTGPSDGLVDLHCHISKTSYLRFLQRAGWVGYSSKQKHRVLYFAVDTKEFSPSVLRRAQGREALGLSPDAFVLVRVGRPDVRKWSDFLIDAMPLILRRIPEAVLIFMGIPHSRRRYLLRQSWSNGVVFLEPTLEDDRIATVYNLADVLVHSSRRGESFGYALAEAMACGVPVVVNSTPWADNAQVELVDHMVNGIVANTPEDYAEAVVFLHHEPDLRRKMGDAAVQKAGVYAAEKVARALGRLVVELLHQKGYPVASLLEATRGWEVYPSVEELEAYPEEYDRRLKAAWSTNPPRKSGNVSRRLRWLARDVIDILGYKLRLRRVDSRWI